MNTCTKFSSLALGSQTTLSIEEVEVEVEVEAKEGLLRIIANTALHCTAHDVMARHDTAQQSKTE